MDESQKLLAVFDDFHGRYSAVIKALTTDLDKCRDLCSVENEFLCLYGNPDGNWEVRKPEDMLPADLPEPALGINFRKEMSLVSWKRMVAVHSDSWLIAIAFFNATGLKFDAKARKLLFNKISGLPTIAEVVAEIDEKPTESTTPETIGESKNSSLKSSPQLEPQTTASMMLQEEEKFEGEDEDEHEKTLCGTCGDDHGADEFWIGCDVCDRWFHGECVGITPAKAERIKRYKCHDCSKKRIRT